MGLRAVLSEFQIPEILKSEKDALANPIAVLCVTIDKETYAVPLNQSKLLNIYDLWFAYCWCFPTFCTKMKFRKHNAIPPPFPRCTQQ